MGVNAAGIKSKITSFKNALKELKPAVFFIEETKNKDEGRMKFNNYDVFELTRKNRDGGGGVAIGCIKDLQAVWVRDGNDKVEAISVDIFLKSMKIRCCAAYGCQENDIIERKEAFWDHLNDEVSLAQQADAGFILHFDGNLWAGDKIIPGDPKIQNKNGKYFQKFLEKHPNLTVVNSLTLCEGLITRSRMKQGKLEESVIDFFVVCNRILPFIKKMVIDNDKKFVLSNYGKVKKGGKATDSDHYTQFMDVELEIQNVKPERIEIYDFKKRENQEKFQKLTSGTTEFTECFNSNAPLNVQIENWRKVLKSYCKKAFTKIKIKRKRSPIVNKEICELLKIRGEIRSRKLKDTISNKKEWTMGEFSNHQRKHVVKAGFNCTKCSFESLSFEEVREHDKTKHEDHALAQTFMCEFCDDTQIDAESRELHIIDHKISLLEAQDNRKKIMSNFKCFSDNPENINMGKMWKILKKLWPKYNSIPKAKKNHVGKIISKPQEIKDLMKKEYIERLRKRPIRPDMKTSLRKRKDIFIQKLELAKSKKSPEWTMKNLNLAIAKLKNDKSRDFEGYSNELFKNNVIGIDLKMSLLIMFNQIKKNCFIPKFMKCANITTVPKKGSQIELRNERGIFRVSVLRSILMNLIYERKYQEIDAKMSECQMGGRRKRGCKNNIFILNGIIHETMKSRQNNSVVLQYYDYSQMFDSIDLREAIQDMFDSGMDDENLALLYQSNKEIAMAVKTAHGVTDRVTLKDLVLQGDTFSSLMASVQVDRIGQYCIDSGNHILYKKTLPIGFLGMVDDVVGVTEAGFKASELNSVINVKTAEKTLQFGASKCKYMIVGKCDKKTKQQNLHIDHWKTEHQLNKRTGEYDGKVKMEITDFYKYLGFMISNKGDNMVNIKEMKKKLISVLSKPQPNHNST